MKYRAKPVIIEAIQWNGKNGNEIKEFAHDSVEIGNYSILIDTLEGMVVAQIGDYIIRGIKGEFYPCKADIFNEKYEEI